MVSGIVVLHISAGFVNNPGMVGFFVAMPYVAAFLSLLYFSVVRFQLPKEKDKFRFGESNLLFSRMRMAGIFLGISLAGCILGEFAFIRSAPTGEPLTLETIFLALEVLGSLVTFILISMLNRVVKKVSIKYASSKD